MPTVSRSAGGPRGSAVADTYLTETLSEECLQRTPRGLACHTGASCRPHPGSPSSSSSPLGSRAGLGPGGTPSRGRGGRRGPDSGLPAAIRDMAGWSRQSLPRSLPRRITRAKAEGCGPEPPHTVRNVSAEGETWAGGEGWDR